MSFRYCELSGIENEERLYYRNGHRYEYNDGLKSHTTQWASSISLMGLLHGMIPAPIGATVTEEAVKFVLLSKLLNADLSLGCRFTLLITTGVRKCFR